MNLDLHSPCGECPFRTDVEPFLRADRMQGICDHLLNDRSFACHKTIDHDEDGEPLTTPRDQHCAGAMIMLDRMGRPNQMMRIAYRIGSLHPENLNDAAPVYTNASETVAAYRAAESRIVQTRRRKKA